MLNKENYLDSLIQAQLIQFLFLLVLLRPLNFHISSRNISIIEVGYEHGSCSVVNKMFSLFSKK